MADEPTLEEDSKPPPTRITEDLRSFYAQHGVDVDRLQEGGEGAEGCFASRFIRLNPAVDTEETLSKLKKELEHLSKDSLSSSSEPIPIPWLDDKLGFYALPGDFKLSQSQCYQEGRIYGMDVSSGAAVAALLSNQYDKDKSSTSNAPTSRVLDLCCAPGLKLCALADYLEQCNNGSKDGVVVGVDVAEHRIATTKRILHKYRMMSTAEASTTTRKEDSPQPPQDPVRIRLYCGDGTKFDHHDDSNKIPNLVFDSQTAREESAVSGKRKRMNKSAKARERKRLKSLATIDFQQQEQQSTSQDAKEEKETPNTDVSSLKWTARPFDCVLVDAECSTDGSLKHIQKQINASDNSKHDDMVAPLLVDQQKLKELVELQKQLAAAGFRMLKPGGTMVYSTCSLSQDQNEDVVEWVLQEYSETAFLVPLDFTSAMKDASDISSNPKIKEGKWGVRFEPNLLPQQQHSTTEAGTAPPQMFFGGGFFLAKIGKKLQAAE